MNTIARVFLYLQTVVFIVIGLASLFVPEIVAPQVHLIPASLAGTSEFRGLYGGGFLGFGLATLGGLRCKPLAPGLLMAMAMVMGGVVVGRIASLMLDHEYEMTIAGGALELLIALACWIVYKHDKVASVPG